MSKQDRLESFVRDHRKEFDGDQPPADLWSRIDQDLPGKGKVVAMRPMALLLRVAAVVVVVFGIGLIASQLSNTGVDQPVATEEKEPMYRLSDLSPEMAEIEFYYASEIDQLMERMTPEAMDEDVKSALEDLDKEYLRLQQEMGENRNNTEVLEAMIQTYRLKLEILMDVYRATQPNDNQEKTKDHVTNS